jgi:hypothetical protein
MMPRQPRAKYDGPLCGSPKKQGPGTCTQKAGWGTDHEGQGKCKLHGGKTPIRSGRYSTITRPRIAELLDQFRADPDPLNLLEEVLLLRALIVDYSNRYDEMQEALIAWHASFSEGYQKACREAAERGDPDPDPVDHVTKPRQIIDILEVGKFVVAVGTLTERIQKQRDNGMITMATLDRILGQVGEEIVAVAQEAIHDQHTRTHFLELADERLNNIQVESV